MANPLCGHCGTEIDSPGRSDRLWCSNRCGNRARNKRHYDNNPETFREQRKKLRGTHPERQMLNRVRHRAKRDGIPFDLDETDLRIPERCPVLGIKLTHYFGKGSGYHADSPSVDKIWPTRGYTKGNVRVISARANLLKSDATPEELEAVLLDLRRIYDNSDI